MNKIVMRITLLVTLILNVCIPALAAQSYSNFTIKTSYTSQFTDVDRSDWFFSYVRSGYEYGLIKGSTATEFSPDGNLTIAETITLAVRLHSIYTNGAEPNSIATSGESWYDPYVKYALKNAIITSAYSNYDAVASRGVVAQILANALPDNALGQICTVRDNAIPDVSMTASYAAAVYKLYRAGILTGSDAKGAFEPGSSITRSEIAAICVRIAEPSQRVSVGIRKADESVPQLTGQQISEKCASGVFFIQTYSFNGEEGGTGSGFFISSNGLAITNHHVVANSIKLKITTQSGKTYDDVEIIDLDKENDLALLKVNGTGFSYLEMADSSTLKQGQQVYAFGSPLGLENTMSQGIIASTKRVLDGVTYVQISVPIAPGSSGGALVDEYGKVVGITSAGFVDSTGDLNLAIPIHQTKALDRKNTEALIDWCDDYYPGFTEALDFGSFSGVKLLTVETNPLGYELTYDAYDFHSIAGLTAKDCFTHTIYYYYCALLEQGFVQTEEVDSCMGTFATNTEIVELSLNISENSTISVSVKRVPKYYKEFAKLPDFGWYTGVEMHGEAKKSGESTLYFYEWSDYYSHADFKLLLFSYFELMERQNIEYVYANDCNYLFEGNGVSVLVVINDKFLYLDVKPI